MGITAVKYVNFYRLSYILACFIVLLIIRAPFYVLLVFVAMCSVFWLFWLSYHYLPSEWLEKLLRGSLVVARGSSPESPGRRVHMIFLVYCIASLFYYVFVLSPAPTVAEWLGRWTYDQQVASSNPGLSAIECNPGQVVNTHVPLSPSSIIWYQPMGGDALRLGR